MIDNIYFQIWLLGAFCALVLMPIEFIFQKLFNKLTNFDIYQSNLKKLFPLELDLKGRVFLVLFRLVAIIFVCVFSWLYVSFAIYSNVIWLLDTLNWKGKYVSEQSRRAQLPLITNPYLSNEEAWAHFSFLKILSKDFHPESEIYDLWMLQVQRNKFEKLSFSEKLKTKQRNKGVEGIEALKLLNDISDMDEREYECLYQLFEDERNHANKADDDDSDSGNGFDDGYPPGSYRPINYEKDYKV